MRNWPGVFPRQPALDDSCQGEGRERSASVRTLDRGSAAKPEVLQPAGTQPGHPRAAGATERASFPQAGRIAVEFVSQPGETSSGTVTSGTLRHEPVVAGHRQHRLPHCLRWELLQCSVHFGATSCGSALHADHGGDLPQGRPDRFPPTQSRAGTSYHPERTPPQESSSPSGVAAFADGELGAQHRLQYGAVVRANPEREAAPGDGLPLLSRHHSPGAAVLEATHGSGSGTGTTCPGLSLSEREVDLEELARRGSLVSITTRLSTSDP